MKRIIIASLILVTILVGVAFAFVETIPARDATYTTMNLLKYRILVYARDHAQLPADLSVLPSRPGFTDRNLDAWGRKILYQVDSSGIVTLKSLGRDGAPGGTGKDTDIVCAFASRDREGKGNDPLVSWTADSTQR
jgi:hypothetical protein